MKGAEDEARGKSGRERAKIRAQVRQLQGLTLGAVQAQVTEQSPHAKVSDPRMEVKKKNGFSWHCGMFCHHFALRLLWGRKHHQARQIPPATLLP